MLIACISIAAILVMVMSLWEPRRKSDYSCRGCIEGWQIIETLRRAKERKP